MGDWVAKFYLQLLGGFRLSGGKGKPVSLSGRKAQALLAYLALNPGPHSREKLATLLWGDRMDEQARHSLRQAMSSLRKALGDGKTDPLTADVETAGLIDDALSVDALSFVALVGAGSPQALQEAAALYAGPLLDGFSTPAEGFDEWLGRERERLHALACGVLERLAGQQETAGEAEQAIEMAHRLLGLDPTREEGHRLLMRLLAAAGHRAEALKQYQACAGALRRELDAEPSTETTRLYEEIRRGEAPHVEKPAMPEAPIDPLPSGGLPPLPDRPSIAVLPFENMSGDLEQEYFSDGISEDLITTLSNFSRLSVVSRNTSFTYKGRAQNVKQVGKELGVGYLLEGSVRKAGNRVRITAQLIDVQTDRHLWSERYDRVLEDIFAVQDEITRHIVEALEVGLLDGEQIRVWRGQTQNGEAWDCFLRGRNIIQGSHSRQGVDKACKLWEQAVSLDGNFARAIAPLGQLYGLEAIYGWGESFEISMAKMLELVEKALALDHSLAYAHMVASHYHLHQREYDQALAAGEKAVRLEPNGAEVMG
ncbi:MAG: BTAD domain-containing putative transcriptional regulator, partial [bacterium]